jgi:hypothetical protein
MPQELPHSSSAQALAEWVSRRQAFTQRPSSAPDLMVHKENQAKKQLWGEVVAGEMAQWLKALVVLPEVLAQFPAPNPPHNPL